MAYIPAFGFLSFIFLVPIIFFFEKSTSQLCSFLGGFLTGAILFSIPMAGLINLSWFVYLIITIIIGSIYGITTFLLNERFWSSHKPFKILTLLLSWILIEYISSSYALFGASAIPLSFGYAIVNTHFIEVSNVSGVHGASVFLLASNYLVYSLIKKDYFLNHFYITLSLLISIYLLSYVTKEKIHSTTPLSITLVEPRITREVDNLANRSRYVSEVIESALKLEAETLPTDLIVYPESTFSINTNIQAFTKKIRSRVAIFGGSRFKNGLLYNSVYIKDGKTQYWLRDKNILVPYFETSYTKGSKDFIPFSTLGINTIILICWESVFESQIRVTASDQQNLVTIISNDTFAEGTLTPQWHFRTAQLLAATLGSYVIYSSQKGPSGIFKYDGTEIPLIGDSRNNNQYKVALDKSYTTLYDRFGDWVGLTCLLSFFVCCLLMLKSLRTSSQI